MLFGLQKTQFNNPHSHVDLWNCGKHLLERCRNFALCCTSRILIFLQNSVLPQISCNFDLSSRCDLMLPTHEIVIPQDNLYVNTWETDFVEFPKSTPNEKITPRSDDVDSIRPSSDDAGQWDRIFTDVDLRSI